MMLSAFVISLFVSNVILKKRYDSLDKSDIYWNFNKISSKPFKYLKIQGVNVTNIVFTQQKNCSVRVLDYWGGYEKDSIKTYESGDTLHLQFVKSPADFTKKFWMEHSVLVRIGAPQLLAIDCSKTKFIFEKFDQKELTIKLADKSKIEVQSNTHNIDKLEISQQDSSQVLFYMNHELKQAPQITAKNAIVKMQGLTLLDIGHIKINNLQLDVTESSTVIMSGYNLKSH